MSFQTQIMKPKAAKFNSSTTKDNSLQISKAIAVCLWIAFLGNILSLLFLTKDYPGSFAYGLLKINGFTVLIWTVVTFFSALITTYGRRYLEGFEHYLKFHWLTIGFTISVMFLVMSNHVGFLLLSWMAMGLVMAKLIGIDRKWKEAQAAARYTRSYFLASVLCLALGLFVLVYFTGAYQLDSIMTSLKTVPSSFLLIASLLLIIAAIIQSAIYPFHRWILSAMTAPTPASALMHAGFVNGAGILLTIFAVLLFESNTLDILFVIGGLTAVIAQFTKLLQVNVRQKLACSTIAQMGFMVMQCGLGFFNAAVVHLILHGFYKAYLFLSSGETVEQSLPSKPLQIKIKPLQAVFVLLCGALGAILFIYLTGKALVWDSSVFLTLIVAIAVGQVTYNIVKENSLTYIQKIVLSVSLFFIGIALYAISYNAVTAIMSDMKMVVAPTPLSVIQVVFGVLFLIGFFIMKLGIYRKVPWLYVKLLNLTQPGKNTVLTVKS